MSFAYRLRSTGTNSAQKYGPCEVCKEHASEVYIQTEFRGFHSMVTGMMGYTAHNARGVTFGHMSCLIGSQRTEAD